MNDEGRQINCASTFLRHSKFLVRYSAVHVGLKPAKAGIAGLSATDSAPEIGLLHPPFFLARFYHAIILCFTSFF
jgi:hypothetical protein